MAKKIQTETKGALRHMVLYNSGGVNGACFRITTQIDHTWFLTVFGQKNMSKPYDVNSFMEFVIKEYDDGASFVLDDHGVASKCRPTLYFTTMGIANKFLDDFTQLLEELV